MKKDGDDGAAGRKVKGERRGGASGSVIEDPRFASMHMDPRFSRFPKKKGTVEIDKRFSGMFSDPDFQTKTTVDKRGRQIKQSKRGEDLKRYYRLKDEAEWKEDGAEGHHGQDVAAGGDVQVAEAGADAAAKVDGSQGETKKEKKMKKAKEKAAQKKASEDKEAQGVAGQGSVLAAQRPGQSGSAAVKKPGQSGSAAVRKVQKGSKPSSAGETDDAGRDQGEPEEEEKEGGEEEEDEEEEAEEEDEEDEKARLRFLRARGMIDVSSSDEEDGELSGSEELQDEGGERDEADVQREWGIGAMAANPEEPIPLMDETSRIAIVDLDWDHVKAQDIFAVLRSFAPKGGEVRKVTVYPSDYGLQRMAEEAAIGPKIVFTKPTEAKGKDSAAEGAAATAAAVVSDGDKGTAEAPDDKAEEEDDGHEVDKQRLAMYERSKLRYYYAIVECDTVATAAQVYAECDGLEFERSACKFDLRFVPDEQSFEGRQVRDSATSLPSGYEPPSVFNLSLQHTDPKLSWDADDADRKQALHRKLSKDEIKQGDFEAYLGSDDDEGDEVGEGQWEDKDPEKIRERYRALLLGGADDKAGKGQGGEEDDEDEEDEEDNEEGLAARGKATASKPRAAVKSQEGMEMEVTFVSGLENLGAKLMAKKKEDADRKGETVWEAYLRKKREKRKERKHGRNQARGGQEESSDSSDYDEADEEEGKARAGPNQGNAADDDDPFNDPFFQDGNAGEAVSSGDEAETGRPSSRKQSGKSRKLLGEESGSKAKLSKEEKQQLSEDAARRKAELELLLMDDAALREATVRGMPGVLKGIAKGASGQRAEEEEEEGTARKKKQSRKERLRLRKEERRTAREGSDDEDVQRSRPDGQGPAGAEAFTMNMDDPRFTAMFNDPGFALDPTDPRFVKMKGSEMTKELSKRRSKAPAQQSEPEQKPKQPATSAAAIETSSAKDSALHKIELKAMVAKLKRKADGPSSAAGAERAKKKK